AIGGCRRAGRDTVGRAATVTDNDDRGGGPPGPAAPQQTDAGRPPSAAPAGPTSGHASGPARPPQADRRWTRRAEIATVIGAVLAALGLVIAVVAWRDPQQPAAGPAATSAAAGSSSAGQGSTASSPTASSMAGPGTASS